MRTGLGGGLDLVALLPFLHRVASGDGGAFKVARGEQNAHFVNGELGLLHVLLEFRSGRGWGSSVQIPRDPGHYGFGLRRITTMEVDNEIAQTGKQIGGSQQSGGSPFAAAGPAVLRHALRQDIVRRQGCPIEVYQVWQVSGRPAIE